MYAAQVKKRNVLTSSSFVAACFQVCLGLVTNRLIITTAATQLSGGVRPWPLDLGYLEEDHEELPSGKRLQQILKDPPFFSETTHYFDWTMFNRFQ